MNYPLLSEYVESIRSAEDNLAELNYLHPVLDANGDPVMTGGNFAVVFKMQDKNTGKYYALKCFTKEQEGRAESYKLIAEELELVNTTYFTHFKYYDKELFVDCANSDETGFPVVLMDWVEGLTLDKFIQKYVNRYQIAEDFDEVTESQEKAIELLANGYELNNIAYQFSCLAIWLLQQPFAHGDLKPDNIIVKEDRTLVLVDYDGMYVPSMKGQKARELGSPDFRHPLRKEDDFDEHIDDFPLSSILLSLLAIANEPSLFEKYGSDGRLLFSEKDYCNLAGSKVLEDLMPLLQNKNLMTYLSLFYLCFAQESLLKESYRIFNLPEPEIPSFMKEEILSTDVEDLYGSKRDIFSAFYSNDGKRLLIGPNDRELLEYSVKEGTKVICNYAFYGIAFDLDAVVSCYLLRNSLKKINIPNSIIIIGYGAFQDLRELKSIYIPSSVREIKKKAFLNCSSLTSIEVDDKNEYYDSRNSCNAIIETKTNKLIAGCSASLIPNGVTCIGEGAFENCYYLTNVELPKSVIEISNYAFSGCDSLKVLSIPCGTKVIGDSAFRGCNYLEIVSLPSTINVVGKNAFKDCHRLTYICIPAGTRKQFEILLPKYKMKFIEGNLDLSVLLNAIRDSDYLVSNVFIYDYNKYRIGKGIEEKAWTDNYGVKYSADKMRLLEVPEKIESYSIRNGTRIICDHAFPECVYYNETKYGTIETEYNNCIQSINIPDSVIKIGDYAFSSCHSLREITIPNSVVELGDNIFEDCTELEYVSLSESLLEINDHAFFNCIKLSFIIIPSGVVEIGDHAFSGCRRLTSITIPNSVMRFGDGVFSGCKSLKSIYIPLGSKSKFEDLLYKYKEILIELDK